MNYKVTVEPTAELMTLAVAKIWLKVDSYTTEDALITSLIVSARLAAESYCNRAFITQTIVMKFDDFSEFELMRSPIQSITSITYQDTSGSTQTLSTDVYELDDYAYPNRIKLKFNQSFPNASSVLNNIVVTYKAGYGDASTDVPNGIIDSVKVILADYYKNRENPVRRFPTLAELMLNPYRIRRFV